ncbi:PREDICTED: cytochrome P450 3A9-like [Rhagoletis zephyria]|uniref:cytochrome P450 3A9-like n=1 Tax=Rhagoletis zephyria TaxID=28612 RepID=UPI0008112268|nr:PREDICTED: cytochrome P450 3A9-like [Rhagoletis zephyria]
MFLTVLLLVTVLAYLYIRHRYSYWSKREISGPKPSVFTLGNAGQIARESPLEIERRLAAQFGPVYGNFNFLEPVLTVADARLLRLILIKDFNHFINRRAVTSYHIAINNGLLFAEGTTWKRLRAAASPNFTSGRLRRAVPVINNLLDKLDEYFEQAVKEKGGLIADSRDPFIGFAIETIANTSFATETGDSSGLGGARSVNPFVTYGLQLPEVSPLRAVAYFTLPAWVNALIAVDHPFNAVATDWYMKAILEIIRRTKEERNAEGNKSSAAHNKNLVQLLVEASVAESKATDESKSSATELEQLTASMEREFDDENNNSGKTSTKFATKTSKLTDEEVVGVAMNIFAAGFHTIAVALTGVVFELAWAPPIQERLVEELKEKLESLDPHSDEYYQVLMATENGCPLLDAVIKETNRKYPALARLERRLVSDSYTLPLENGKRLELKKGQLIEIPTVAVHYNSGKIV